MSDETVTDNLEDADDRLFNGALEDVTDPDEVVVVPGEAETGFEAVTDQPATQPAEPASATPEATSEEAEHKGLPPAAIAAIKDERKKRQELQEQLAALQSQPSPQQQREAFPQQQQGIPNPAVDPVGYHQFMQNQVLQVEASNRLNTSRGLAMQAHGAETVEAAMAAFQASQAQDPVGYQARYEAFGTSPDPVGEIVKWHKQHSLMTEIGGDPEAYRAKIEAEIMAKLQGGQVPAAQQPAAQPGRPALPPRIASTPGVMPGGNAQHNMETAEKNLFGR